MFINGRRRFAVIDAYLEPWFGEPQQRHSTVIGIVRRSWEGLSELHLYLYIGMESFSNFVSRVVHFVAFGRLPYLLVVRSFFRSAVRHIAAVQTGPHQLLTFQHQATAIDSLASLSFLIVDQLIFSLPHQIN